MSEKFPVCLECERDVTNPKENIRCPVCGYETICETCLKPHYKELHPDMEFILPTGGREYQSNNEDAKKVRIMASCNISYENMAEILGCKKSDIKKHYKFQMEQGAEEVVFNIATKLYEVALTGNVPAMTFWLKTRAGWKDSVESGPGGESDVNKLIQGMSPVDKTQRILHLLGAKKKNEG